MFFREDEKAEYTTRTHARSPTFGGFFSKKKIRNEFFSSNIELPSSYVAGVGRFWYITRETLKGWGKSIITSW